MALDINETIEDDGNFKSSHMLYKDGVRVKYPDKAAEIHFAILPALADPEDKASYLPYRDEETDKFNRWAAPGYYYPFVNRERSIISPKTHDPKAIDFVEELIKAAKAHPDYQIIAGFGSDGKKIKDAWKNQEVRLPSRSTIFCANSIILYDRDIPSDEVYLMQIPKTAFKGPGGEEGKKSTWGLISALDLRNRGSADDGTIDEKYYWGDITDPRKLVPLKISQEKSPTGGTIKIYNVAPQDEDTIKVGKSVLEKRFDLENIYHDGDDKEILDYLISAFIDVPQLLKIAFASRVPGFDKLLKAATAKYSFSPDAVDEAVEDEDEFKPSRKTKPEPKEDDEDDIPAVSTRKKRNPADAVADEDDDLPDPTPRRSFAPKDEASDPKEATEVEEEYVPVTKPTRKKKEEQTPVSNLRKLIDED